MRRTLKKGFEKFEILEGRERKPDDALKKFQNKAVAISFLKGFMRDNFNVTTLCNMIKSKLPHTGSSRINNRAVILYSEDVLTIPDKRYRGESGGTELIQ